MTGSIVKHLLVSKKKFKQLEKRAQNLWIMSYPCEPFDLDLNHVKSKFEEIKNYNSKISSNIVQIAQCHHEFFYQVN